MYNDDKMLEMYTFQQKVKKYVTKRDNAKLSAIFLLQKKKKKKRRMKYQNVEGRRKEISRFLTETLNMR